MSNLPTVAIIAAMAQNRIIGNNNNLPWRLPADLKRFKQLTLDSCLLMGRKTYESIGRVLARREIIVISRKQIKFTGTHTSTSLPDAIELAHKLKPNAKYIFIAGGGEIYAEAFKSNLVEMMFLTFIDKDIDGDTYFPTWDKATWREVEHIDGIIDEKNTLAHHFVSYKKIR